MLLRQWIAQKIEKKLKQLKTFSTFCGCESKYAQLAIVYLSIFYVFSIICFALYGPKKNKFPPKAETELNELENLF